MRLLLIRHAQTVWNAVGRVQGQADPELSELGVAQCRAVGERFTGTALDALHTSDLLRARLTAAAIATTTETKVTLEPGLREVGLGRWEGVDVASLKRDEPERYAAWVREPTWDMVPEGEGGAAFRERVVNSLGRILAGLEDHQTIALVTHIGVIRLLLSIATGLESRGLRWPWAIDNTGITTLLGPADVSEWDTPSLRILAVNDSSHLAADP